MTCRNTRACAAAIGGKWKELNENLAPLRRYLERQVGRPWSLVYSEIAADLRADNTVQQHVRVHLRDFSLRCSIPSIAWSSSSARSR